ncbi:MAG: alkaline phosphatase PhoX, partial [Phycisphaerales bacterium]
YMNGEETGAEGRAYAHIVSGSAMNQTWQLPHLGKFSWENSVASPFAQQKTVVMGTDDSTPGQVYMYVGNKTAAGNDIERAGLTNGNLFGIKVAGLPTENRTAGASGTFTTFNHGDVANRTGASLQTESVTQGVTEFLRPEDGAWDTRPGMENNFYFVTTDRYETGSADGDSRLYRMTFNDITNPEAGGTITMLLEGGIGGPQMMDNMCIDSLGRILIQEDIGGQSALSKIWLYDTNSSGLALVAQHDAARFAPGAPGLLTIDEESSGIIDAKDILGDGWFLLDVQAHYGIAGELVEGGQMLAMYVDPAVVPAPATLGLVGLAGVFAGRRRR